MTVFSTDNCHIDRSLHQSRHRRAHSLHAARASVDGFDSLEHDVIFYIRGIRLSLFLEVALCRRVSIGELCLCDREDPLHFSFYGCFIFSRHQHCHIRLERNRIAEASAGEVSDFHAILLEQRQENPHGNLVGIGPVEDNVLA